MSPSLEEELASVVGAANVVTQPDLLETACRDWRGRYAGKARCLIRPASTAEVAAAVEICARHGAPIVPQGGNTGVCGGAIPDQSGRSVIISLGRMNRIREIDAVGNAMTVEAGCLLETVRHAADASDRIFPLDLGSSGTCQIGGNISTNAGGTAVLRYGNMRDLVLGLEVVLPDGGRLDGLRSLRKDNAGYDLKQFFIGAEGTLGIVTGAVLKLFPKPRSRVTAFVALSSCENALKLFETVRMGIGDRLNAFELMSDRQLAAVLDTVPETRRPVSAVAQWWILLEAVDTLDGESLRAQLETVLAGAIDADIATDATVARNGREAAEFWRLRHSVSDANVRTGRVVSHDTSVPISRIADFIGQCDAALSAAMPQSRLHYVGHVGDGNVHVVAIFPRETASLALEDRARAANGIVHDIAARMGGSIAAEHGVGQSLLAHLPRYKSAREIRLMQQIKSCLDPDGIMNPGKVVGNLPPMQIAPGRRRLLFR